MSRNTMFLPKFLATLRMLRRVGLAAGLWLGVLGAPEVTLTRAQLPWLAGAIGFGGVLGPVLLMVGLSHTGAAARRCC